MSSALKDNAHVIIVERDGRNRSTRFHGTRAGGQLPACSQLVQQLHESEWTTVTVAQARARGKTACSRCLGGEAR